MADLKAGPNPLFLRDEELRQGIELLFYAYRDHTAEADAILGERGLGRAHHRVIYFVGRYPGTSVGELLDILRITKQSLSRVLGELLTAGLVQQRKGARDRRQRLLTLSEAGLALEQRVCDILCRRLARAYRRAGAEAVAGFRTVLGGITEERDLRRMAARGATAER
jgi:DNA-binding MarR family transcriptional regulator